MKRIKCWISSLGLPEQINYHKLGGLKQQKRHLSQFWSQESEIKVFTALRPLQRLQETFWPLPPPASAGRQHSWVCGCIALISATLFTLPSLFSVCCVLRVSVYSLSPIVHYPVVINLPGPFQAEVRHLLLFPSYLTLRKTRHILAIRSQIWDCLW